MTLPKTPRALVVYGYSIEFMLVGLIFVILWQRGWVRSVSEFIDQSAAAWTTLFGLFCAGAMAARLVFFSLNSGDFGAWLEWKKLGSMISAVFLFNLLLFLLVTAVNIVLIYVKGTWLSKLGIFVGILGFVNSITFSFFVHRLSRLQAVFNLEFKKAIGDGKSQK